MPPTDASADAGPVPVHPGRRPYHPGRSGPAEDTRDCEDTLDLRLPAELRALFAGKTPRPDVGERPDADTTGTLAPGSEGKALGEPGGTVAELREQADPESTRTGRPTRMGRHDQPAPGPADMPDLLDHVGTWGPTPTPVGSFQFVPVQEKRDLPIISRWMNDPAVATFWQLAGSLAQTEAYLRTQLSGDGRSVPCLGLLDGTPMSYWEIYRADLDPLARRYPARPHDTGLHLLIGDAADRGRGLGSALLRAVADLVLDRRPACARVVAEPDLHNTPSVAAFLNAGYRYAAEVDLPGKRAALMIRDRSLRHLM
ncbi:GNAT family N-acetyltransferase [Streptomyces sp. NPDC007851]|uniref:GNAT family N-acetyltransferase n=1 Tax=Streptomyces sp. NPDC007851 TaxID=3155008 RepID=UPI0033C32CD4